jgi:ribonuclease-3
MDRRAAAIVELEARLGHVFADRDLLEHALTHASVGSGSLKVTHNERLEFLGDRVLALVIAEALLERDPTSQAGPLSKHLHLLVAAEACAEVGRALALGPALRLPGGETRRGAREQKRFLADACEALIGAVYLDAGFEVARERVLALWSELLDRPFDEGVANPKSHLQEWAAAAGRGLPDYRLVSRDGPDHAPRFTVEVSVEGHAPERAVGSSLREAEKAAARALLEREGAA